MPQPDTERRRGHDMEIGMLTEAVNTLKTSLRDIGTEVSKQTGILSGIAQQLQSGSDKMAEFNKTQSDHGTRIQDLEESRSRVIGAAGALSFVGTVLGYLFGKHS